MLTNINDFESGQIFMTKKGYKMEIVSIHKDKILGECTNTGTVEVKLFSHRNSQNCQSDSYGWGHNSKYFMSFLRVDGKDGLINKFKQEGWSLNK